MGAPPPRCHPRLARLRRALLPLAAALAACGVPAGARADAGTLWHLVHDQCVPHAMAHDGPGPCAEVSLAPDADSGHVLLKDRRGVLQFLLIPTRRTPGLDDPRLVEPGAPPWWAHAWRARHWLDERHGRPLPREDVVLAINSAWARSQDQLHIHLSCIRPDLKAFLAARQAEFGDAWTPLRGGWLGHPYWVRRVDGTELDGSDPFRDVAAHVPGAAADMAHRSIAVVGMRFSGFVPGFLIMAGQVDWLALSWGSSERDTQDHDCAVLHP